jgi:hypothetical protein
MLDTGLAYIGLHHLPATGQLQPEWPLTGIKGVPTGLLE